MRIRPILLATVLALLSMLSAGVAPVQARDVWHDISMAVVPGKTPTYPGNPPVVFSWAMACKLCT